jgi:signal transduction histidine kinase
VTLAISVPLPAITADTEMIRRVLINLVENASKFSPLDGALEIGAQAESGQVRVWVQDSGPGISPEYQEVIFEKFRQLKNQPQLKGFGIGLAFCRLAVQAHGGKIWVESQPDQGSRFIFTLPAG